MRLTNVALQDDGSFPNAAMRGPSVPATVSFDVEWSGVMRRFQVRDEMNGYFGDFIETTATIQWSAQQEGFEFVSDPAPTSQNVFSIIGAERNGVFFR